MERFKKIVSFCLTLAIILGMVVIPSPVNAKISSNDIKEVSYKLVEENGIPYREYNLADLVDINYDAKSREEIENINSIGTMAVGDFIPDAENYQVKVNWGAWSMTPDKLGTDVYFTIYDSVSRKTIAKTDMVTGTGLYKFKETADFMSPGVSTDRSKWRVRWPNEVRFDIRLITDNGSATAPAVFQANITQRAMTLYRAEYHTNSSKPGLKVYRRNLKNEVKEVDINNDNIKGNQYYSFIEKPKRVYYEGKTIDIINPGSESEDSYSCNDLNASQLVQIYTKVPGKTTYDRGPGQFTDNGTPYRYLVTGDYEHPHIVTVRQDLTVKFDANKGTWKNSAPADQTIGHSMKLADKWAGLGPIDVPAGTTLTPPVVGADKPKKEFQGWCIDANGNGTIFTDAAGYTEEIKEDTTFYAIYKEKAQGKVAIQYVDGNGDAIKDKYKIAGTDYPAEATGNVGEDVELSKIPEPKFIGYERNGDIVVTGKKYDENGRDTVEVPYKKLADIIPEDKASEDVKDTYKKVTIKVDKNKGKFKQDNAEKTETSFTYYVNPVENKSLKDVLDFSKLTAESKDANKDKIDTENPWKFTPGETKVQNPVAVELSTKVDKDNFKGVDEVVMEVKFIKEQGTVKYVYDYNKTGMDPVPADPTNVPDKPEDVTKDVGETVTVDNTKPDKKKLEVKDPTKKFVIANWEFQGWKVNNAVVTEVTVVKAGVTIKGTWKYVPVTKESVTRKFVDADGNALPEANGEFNKFPTITEDTKQYYPGQNADVPDTINKKVKGTKGNERGTWEFDGWYPGNLNATKGSPLTVKAQGTNEYLGKWVFTKENTKAVTFSFKFYNSKKPNEELPANVVSGNFDPKVPEAQTDKYVGDSIELKTFNDVKRDKDNKGNDLGLQGTWKFDGWYRGDTKLTPADAKVSANDEENKLVGKWILTETETKEVTRVFVIDKAIMGDGKDVPKNHVLPQGVTKQKPNDTKNYIGSEQTPGKDNFDAVEEIIGEKIGTWTFKEWNLKKLTVVENPGENDNKFVGTWTWTQLTSDKPTVDQPKADDTVIKGKGKKGSTIVVTTPDGKTHTTTVGDNGDWSVNVPPVKENDKIKVEQKEKGKKTSDPVEVTVERKIKYFGHFYEPSPDYLNTGVPAKKEEKVQEKYLEAYRWYVKGNEMGMFMPKKGITRAEVAQMFARALEYDKAMVNVNITPYTDVDANAWYYEAVQKTSAAGIFKGSDKGTFMPTREITKAELIATIARFQHLSTKAGNTLNLQANHWATAEVEAAYQEGWLDIYTNGTAQFAADEVISREEVVTILNRAFGRIADTKYIDDNAHTMTNFPDATKDMWSYYEIMTAANTYLVDKMWVNHATKDNGPETLKEMIEWVKPLIDNKDVREVVEQVRFQR